MTAGDPPKEDATVAGAPAEDAPVYRALLCHVVSDLAAARRLQRRLARFPIAREQVGLETSHGPVPRSLRPILRLTPGRDDSIALDAPTETALDQSEVLIVIASPAASRSARMNELVRRFRHRHPHRAVVAVVVEGADAHGHHDLFPPALCYELDVDGAITTVPRHVEVGDMRPDSGERARVPSEIAALLTGLEADDLYRRARRLIRWRWLRLSAIGVSSVILLIAAGYFGLQGYREFRFRNEVAALLAPHVPASAAHAPPGAQEFLTEAMRSIREKAITQPRYARAVTHLRAGRIIEGEGVLREIAYELGTKPNIDPKVAAEAFRDYAAVAGLIETSRPLDPLARAAALDPTDPETFFRQGWLAAASERTEDAVTAYRALLALPGLDMDRREAIWARFGLGEILLARGNVPAAAAILAEARAAATRAAQSSDPSRQRDLAVALERTGDVQLAQRDLAGAEQSYRASQAILIRLAEADKNNFAWQRDVALSHGKLGNLLLARSDAAGAVRSYATGRDMLQRLANAQPANTTWLREVARNHLRAARALEAQGDRTAALDAQRKAMAILEQLASREPFADRVASNAELHRELLGVFMGMAEFQLRGGQPVAARPLAARAVTLANDLMIYFPRHPSRKPDLDAAEALRARITAAIAASGG